MTVIITTTHKTILSRFHARDKKAVRSKYKLDKQEGGIIMFHSKGLHPKNTNHRHAYQLERMSKLNLQYRGIKIVNYLRERSNISEIERSNKSEPYLGSC